MNMFVGIVIGIVFVNLAAVFILVYSARREVQRHRAFLEGMRKYHKTLTQSDRRSMM